MTYDKQLIREPFPAPKKTTLKLSDLYYNKDSDPMLELKVKQINIKGYPDSPGSCRQLYEYEWFVERIRENCKIMQIEKAVNTALDDLPETFTIRQFLMLNKSEVIDMSIFEYDEEKHLRLLRGEAYEEGHEEGRKEGREEGARLVEMKMSALKAQLLSEGKSDVFMRAVDDKEYRDQLFKYYFPNGLPLQDEE